MLTPISRDLRQMNGIPEGIGAMFDCRTVWGFPQIDSTAVDCGAVELDDLTFRRPRKIYWFLPLYRHPVWPDGGSVSCELGMYLCDPLCRHLLSFDPVVPRPALGVPDQHWAKVKCISFRHVSK